MPRTSSAYLYSEQINSLHTKLSLSRVPAIAPIGSSGVRVCVSPAVGMFLFTCKACNYRAVTLKQDTFFYLQHNSNGFLYRFESSRIHIVQIAIALQIEDAFYKRF